MRTPLGVLGGAVLAAVVSGCLGGAATPRSTHRTGAAQPLLANAPPGTQVVVRYVVTHPARCPALARCHAVPGSRPRRSELVATRTLTCSPDQGSYRDPAAACAALRDLARLEARRATVCMCPLELSPLPSAVGWFDEHRIHFDLDACAACGLGGHALADMQILLSG